jgi:hypothetical protein
LKSSK